MYTLMNCNYNDYFLLFLFVIEQKHLKCKGDTSPLPTSKCCDVGGSDGLKIWANPKIKKFEKSVVFGGNLETSIDSYEGVNNR